ncbi:hypothetical protein BXZ70DRAFT_706490 [Cristinia sonorae]|uniref:Uncharacterized protein n=1 Tax=Cristinia sonorae TaxID=1940300 RepID=A0A8K0UDZ9_9AGAR|nr:hypothetical protein BXZ70DRAFT_706490 [Cristinia sonorae]
MSKALSNGTLSLKFMQKAQRAKQEAQVVAQQAKVQDEAEWEVPQEVKEQWGIGKSSTAHSRSSGSATYEASYVPSMFTSVGDDDAGSPLQAGLSSHMKGRRKFKHGQEVVAEPTKTESREEKQPGAEDEEPGDTSDDKRSKWSAPPIPTKPSLKEKLSGRTKTVQELIREDTIAQTRKHASPLSRSGPVMPVASSEPVGFMKPAGVDAPKVPAKSKNNTASSSGTKHPRDQDGGKERKKRRKVIQEIA